MLCRLLVLILALIGLSGCTTLVRLEPIKGADQVLQYKRGDGTLISNQSRSVVALVANESEYEARSWLSFSIGVTNSGSYAVDVSEDHVAASVDGQSATVMPAPTLARKAESGAFWARVSVGMAGDKAEREAERAAYTSISGSTTSASGQPSGSFSGQAYDESKAQDAKRKVSEETAYKLEQVDARLQSQLNRIENFALQRTTLEPGDELQAFFVIELPKGKDPERWIQIDVSIGGDTHTFLFHQFKL